ncbi:MAG: ribonuclease HI [Desulfobacterales bacterium]|jgi:ribonuclease HI|nr:ribonuclease HI [Desulfobacterales bacterium]
MTTTTDTDGAHWVRMRFKRNKVWVEADARGRPRLSGGRARIKYQLEQDQDYRVRVENLHALDAASTGDDPPAARGPDRVPAADPPDERTIHIYTDGASSGNPGPSGVGVVLKCGDQRKELSDYIGEATNNIAELLAIEKGLAAVRNRSRPVRVYTDSSYAYGVLCLSWKPKKNIELIARIRRAMAAFPDLRLVKVPGHSGVEDNERADRLAVAAIRTGTRSQA